MKKSSTEQLKLFPYNPKTTYGGDHRNRRIGRSYRPLSSKQTHHIVFKVQKANLQYRSFRHPRNLKQVRTLVRRYSARFLIKIEQISYQHDHIHISARSGRRSNFLNFFRVLTGQIAQTMKVTDTPNGKGKEVQKTGLEKKIVLWLRRPFTRIVKGLWGFRTLQKYILLNEKEVRGIFAYQKKRLRGLTPLQKFLLEKELIARNLFFPS